MQLHQVDLDLCTDSSVRKIHEKSLMGWFASEFDTPTADKPFTASP